MAGNNEIINDAAKAKSGGEISAKANIIESAALAKAAWRPSKKWRQRRENWLSWRRRRRHEMASS